MWMLLGVDRVTPGQASQAPPREHAPAVVVGLLPGVAAWGALLLKNGLRAAPAAAGGSGATAFGPGPLARLLLSDTWGHGIFALEQGFIITSMLLAAAVAEVIDQRSARAALWCFAGAALAGVGIIHSYRFTTGDTAVALRPALDHA